MRCTAKARRTGEQCRKYARAGHAVCPVHGAGYSHKPGGRPLIHGRRSKYGAEVMERVIEKGRRDATTELDRRLTHTLIQNLASIGRALDGQIERETLGTQAEVVRELGRLSFRLTAAALLWLREDPRARLFVEQGERGRGDGIER